MKTAVGYLSSRRFYDERVPQHIQGSILRSFCNANNLKYSFGVVEYSFDNCFLMLEDLVNTTFRSSIVVYSVWQFPREYQLRSVVCEKIAEKQIDLFFAVENISNNNLSAKDFQNKLDLLFDLKSLNNVADYREQLNWVRDSI